MRDRGEGDVAAMAAHGLYVWDVVPDWAQIKFDRMRAVLRAKFDQHADLRELLLSTGGSRLVEAGTVNNAVNRLWGEVDGKGENMLGVMLMELRTEYAKQRPASVPAAKKTAASKKTSAAPTTPSHGCFPQSFRTKAMKSGLTRTGLGPQVR